MSLVKGNVFSQANRILSASRPSSLGRTSFPTRIALPAGQRCLHASRIQHKEYDDSRPHEGERGEHVGSFSRTDNRIQVAHPEEHEMPKSQPVQGRGGFHFRRTLASFSLEDNVGLVTGGARGLGLVMSQALVVSGADVAIVDLNSTWTALCE